MTDERRTRAPLAIAALLPRVTASLRWKRGLSEAGLFTDWAAVVGPQLAAESRPERLVRRRDGQGGTLHVRVAGPVALELQHLEPQVVERINGYFGFRAVARLVMHQGPLPAPPERRQPQRPRLAAAEQSALEDRLAELPDPELRTALAGLGAAVLARSKKIHEQTAPDEGIKGPKGRSRSGRRAV